MKVYFMKQKALDSLQKNISTNVGKYESKSMWVDQYFIEKNTPNFYFDTGVEVEDYQLNIGGPETDFQNSKIIFEAYKDKLNPIQASDLRFWSYLTHVVHWDYMYTRWKIDAPDEDDSGADDEKKSPQEKVITRIKTHYFFGASQGKSFVRQGISRLFWGAYLTYDENSDNPYEFTEYFFSKQDIFQSITERSYARNRVLVLATLKELKKHPDLSRSDIRLFLSKLNQTGAITVLDFLNEEQAAKLCENLMFEVLNVPYIKDGSTFKAYHNVTGKPYEHTLKIENGKTVALGKLLPANIKPRNLAGKKEGSKITISGDDYVIKEIQ